MPQGVEEPPEQIKSQKLEQLATVNFATLALDPKLVLNRKRQQGNITGSFNRPC